MVGSAGNLQVLGNVPDFVPGSQEGTADVWRARAPGWINGTLPGSVYGNASVGGAIIDQRAGAFITQKHTIMGITLPLWAWALAGIVIYRIIK